jgi:Protein of unknown function (DUF3300)
MSSKNSQPGFGSRSLQCLLIVSVAYFSPGQFVALAQQASPPDVAPAQSPAVAPAQPLTATPPAEAASKIPNDKLDSLVAPIALYPDPLLAQTLAASTYPLEIVLLQQWVEKNKSLKGEALTAAVQKQTWDPSIQAMGSLPEVVKQLAGNISWTTDLGNAFLNQQSDVFDAVQRMRAKANSAGKLKSTPQMKVETKVVETKTVVVIEQADPKVIYVPTYNPTVIYGASVYPYPPIYYPPVTAPVLAFTAGVALGAAWNNGWGYNCGWGNNNVNINVNNNYVNHYNKTNVNNINNVNRTNVNNVNNVNRNNVNNVNGTNRNNINNVSGSGNTWKHDAQHRGGAPYSNKATAQQYGGTARTNTATTRPSTVSQKPASVAQQPAASNRMSGGGDSIANRQVSKTPSAKSNNAFSGPSSGMNRNSAMASHDRGSHSMASSRGGGMQRSGGGRRR